MHLLLRLAPYDVYPAVNVRESALAGKRLRAKLAEIKLQLRQCMHEPVANTGRWLKSVVQGYFNYYAGPGNLDSLGLFRVRVTRLWRQALIRRSQRGRINWARMSRL